MRDASRDRGQTRSYLIKTASKKHGGPICTDKVDELVADIMKGGSFIDAVDVLVMDAEYWDQ